MGLYDFVGIVLQLGACLACFLSGKETGAREVVDMLVLKRLITAKDIKKLESNSGHFLSSIR